MKTTLLTLTIVLAASLLLPAVASAQFRWGSIGDLSAQEITNRSMVGDFALPNSPSGIVPRYGVAAMNPVVTRGETRSNLAPVAPCPTFVLAPAVQTCLLYTGRLAPGTPLVIGPVVTADNQSDCAAPGVTLLAYCQSFAAPQLAACPLPLPLALAFAPVR